MEEASRASMEGFFGRDFSGVRVHADPAAAESASAIHARAYTYGNHIAFGAGLYAPSTPAGRRLLAHELAHVVQQADGSPGSPEGREREAVGAERNDVPAALEGPQLRSAPAATAPILQCQGDPKAMRARLEQVRARLAKLRAEEAKFSDDFADSTARQRQRESDVKATKKLKEDARKDSAAKELWGGNVAGARIRRAVTASVSGTTVSLTANIQLSYLALSDKDGQERAAKDIPRIEAAIRDVWQVDIKNGEYAGVQFRLTPKVTYVRKGAASAPDAFQIQVRGRDSEPSSGQAVTGVISLAPQHLEGPRVIVVAHELAHLFGFVDAYLTMKTKSRGKTVETWTVARADPANRPDLLGMIDPDKLGRLEKAGSVSAQDVKRQTGTVRVWEEEASIVLRVLGVTPPPPARPTPDSEDFDPADELERQRREGDAKLEEIRKRRERVEGIAKSVDRVEEIIRLEDEERDLVKRLGPAPAQP